MKKQGFNPLANQDGIATIAMVIAVTTAVLSYTAFTATSYVMMMTESKRQVRQLMGFELMRQIGETAQMARERHHQETFGEGNPDCALADGGATVEVGDFCFPPGGFCVSHPLDPNGTIGGSEICFDADWTAGAGSRTVRCVEFKQKQKNLTFVAEMTNRIRNFNHSFGKKSIEVAQVVLNQAPVAHAVRYQDYMIDRAVFAGLTAPVYGFDLAAAEECSTAASPPNVCMICSEAGAPIAGQPRPACIRLAVCPKNLMGWGACDQAVEADWYWQTVAVTRPVVSTP